MLFSFLIGCCFLVGEAQVQGIRYQRTVAVLSDTIPFLMNRDKVLGCAVALVDGDSVVWSQGFGYTDESRHQPVTPSTVFSLQSVSKTYTAVGFMSAVDRHWFTLAESLTKAWPEFSVRSRWNPTDARRITFRQLLSHRAGLPHEAPLGNNFDDRRCTFKDHVASISDAWLLAPPGERYAYSNLGFDLIAYALERRSGESFAQYMHDAVFAPLAMSSSTYDFDEARQATSFARGQISGKNAPLMTIPMVGAGGMFSTVSDMARFVSFMLNNGCVDGRQILSPQSLNDILTVQFREEGQVGGYGLGVFLRRWRGTTIVWHTGGGYGYTTAQEWIPALNIGVVVLTNDGDKGELAGEVADRALELMADARGVKDESNEIPPYLVGPSVKVPTAALQHLAGTYRSYSGLRTFLIKDDKLCIRAGNTDRPLTAHSPVEFTDGFDRYRFRADSTGSVTIDDLGGNGQDTFILNELPGETPGSNDHAWQQYVGKYVGRAYGQEVAVQVVLKNGYLWASTRGVSKLILYGPGLFFTVWGESVEFKGDTALIRDAPFLRVH